MTVRFLNGFEVGNGIDPVGPGTPTSAGAAVCAGTASFSTNQARTGLQSVRCNPLSTAAGTVTIGTSGASFVHFGLYVATLPSLTRIIYGATGADSINLRLTSAGELEVYLNAALLGTSSAVFVTPGWHWVAARITSGTSVTFLEIDGAVEVTATATVATNATTLGCSGTEASAIDIYVDDFISGTTLLGPSKVSLLRPISDNARGANWFQANGSTTTNLFSCVDNTPPVGVASANEAANPTASIRHSGGANNAYDTNLETYTTAGIAAADTILTVMGIVRHGEDINTGTKLLAIGMQSNPSQTISASFAAGGDFGAHAAESGSWQTAAAAFVDSPSVTLGTSPVLRVSRPETASRVACVDFMGAYVAWTPAPAAERVVKTSPYPQILPQ